MDAERVARRDAAARMRRMDMAPDAADGTRRDGAAFATGEQTAGEPPSSPDAAGPGGGHRHAEKIVDSDLDAGAAETAEGTPDAGLVARIGAYASTRKAASSAKQVLRGSRRELEHVQDELSHKRGVFDNFDAIISEQGAALKAAQEAAAKSSSTLDALKEQLPAAKAELEQTRKRHKEELAPLQKAADSAKQAVRAHEREISRLQKERDACSKAAWEMKHAFDERDGARSRDYEQALGRERAKLDEVEQAHTRLGELRNDAAAAKTELEGCRERQEAEQAPLYEKIEQLQAQSKAAQRDLSRQQKAADDAQAAIDEANAIHEDPQAIEELAGRADELQQTVCAQEEHYAALKEEASAAARQAHVGKIAAGAAVLLVAVVAIVLIVMFAGR